MIKKSLHNTYHRMRLIRNRNHIMRVESENMKRLPLADLTKEEYLAVVKRWDGVSELKILPKYYQMFKTLEHFDPKFVSDDLFMPFILRKLNEKSESEAFVHKGLYDILFKNEIKRCPEQHLLMCSGKGEEYRCHNNDHQIAKDGICRNSLSISS